jgi:hypothetical protein
MTQVNIYKSQGEWCMAAWIDGEFDMSEALDVADDATEAEVRAHLNDTYTGWPSPVTVSRVADI